MSSAFKGAANFDQDISNWNTSSVTDMYNMFYGATSFNQDISDWDVSNVTTFSGMFNTAENLSEINQCEINKSFSSNGNWPYDWKCFPENIITTNSGGSSAIIPADIDGDGDLDIVSSNSNDNSITVYKHNGGSNPNYTLSVIADGIDGQYGIFVADMDNDGDLDIVSSARYENTVRWYENDGASNPSWTAEDIYSNAESIRNIFVSDMNSGLYCIKIDD